MGHGTGLVEVPFGAGLIREGVRLTTFMAPLHEGHLGLLFYVEAERPVAAELVFPGIVLPSAAPFGGDLATSVPLVPTVPEAPDAVLAQFATTIGPEHITYWEYSRHNYIPYHPRGILLPKSAPVAGSSSPPPSLSTTALRPAPMPSSPALADATKVEVGYRAASHQRR